MPAVFDFPFPTHGPLSRPPELTVFCFIVNIILISAISVHRVLHVFGELAVQKMHVLVAPAHHTAVAVVDGFAECSIEVVTYNKLFRVIPKTINIANCDYIKVKVEVVACQRMLAIENLNFVPPRLET